MKEYQSLSHTRWDCKYHVVFIPKRRKKSIVTLDDSRYGNILRPERKHSCCLRPLWWVAIKHLTPSMLNVRPLGRKET